MRITLNNYLNLSDVRTINVAKIMGQSRETIRRWRNSTDKAVTVICDPASLEIEQIEFSTLKIMKPVKGESNE